jgi:hypothetical protein
MSVRSHATVYLALLFIVIVAAAPLPVHATTYYSPLYAGGSIHQGDTLRSPDDCMELGFHYTDAYYNRLNLRGLGGAGCSHSNWDSYSDYDWQGYGQGIHASADEPRGIRAAEADMQDDGNFVIYDLEEGFPVPVWSTHTDGNPGAYLNVQADGNMVIYGPTDAVLWSLY